jgi:integrase
MRGAVVKRTTRRGDVFYAVFRQKWVKCLTRREAELYLARCVAGEDGRGVVRDRRGGDLGAFLTAWLDSESVRRLQPSTQTIYAYAAQRHIIPALGRLRLERLGPKAVEEWLGAMRRRPYRPATAHQAFRVLRTALRTAKRWGLLSDLRCLDVAVPHVARRLPTVWDEEQLRLFLGAARASDYYALYLVLLLTAMRPGEALALRWDNVRLAESRLYVLENLYYLRSDQVWGDRRLHLVEGPTKTHKHLGLWMPPQLTEALIDHRARHGQHDRVFCRPDGTALHEEWVRREDFYPLCDAAKLPRITLYDLRHCHGTNQADHGTPIHVLRQQLGHESESTTLRYYVHVLPDAQRRAVEAFADRLLGPSHLTPSNERRGTPRKRTPSGGDGEPDNA